MTLKGKELASLTATEKREALEQFLREKALGQTEDFPLSLGQQALWLLHQVAPQSAAYNVVLAVRLLPPLSLSVLKSALLAVFQRHGMLRSLFKVRDGEPMQTILASAELSLEPIDAKDLTEDEFLARLLQESKRQLVLEESPVRMLLFGRPAGVFVMLLVVHHVACDAWSLGIILKEFHAFYEALVSGALPVLSPLRADYRDFVEWQEKMLSGPEGEGMWNFWRNQLTGELPLLELPTDYARPVSSSFCGGSYDFTLGPRFVGALRSLSQDHGQTSFVVLLAAFGVLLHRYSGQTDLLIGTPTAGRARSEFEGVVGYFVNPVVVRANVYGDPSFAELLERFGSYVRNALRHADFPFPLLVQRLQPVRDSNRSPIFQVMFNYFRLGQFGLQGHPSGAPRSGKELVLESVSLSQQEGQFDLSLAVGDANDSLICTLKFSTDLFDRATIERMARHYEQLLAAVLDDPTRRLSQLPLLTAKEEAQIATWNTTAAPYPREAGLLGLLAEQVARRPESIAVRQGRRSLTYVALEAAARRVAGLLRSLGVGPDVLVGVCLDRTPDMLVALLGVLKAGGAYVPLDPGFPQARLAFMLEDAGVQVVLTQAAYTGLIPTGVSHVVCLNRDRTQIETAPAMASLPLPDADDLAYVIYTSGSTGQPKGVEIPHGALVNLLATMAREPGFTAADVLLAVTTLSFDIAALELFLPLCCGGTVVLATREEAADAQALMTLLDTTGATVLQATPVTWRMLIEAGWSGTPRLKVLCGGEALPRDLASALRTRAAEVWNVYGPTETTIWSSRWKVEAGDGPVSIGRPIANTRMYVVDRWGNPQPVGVVGELYIGGRGLARGYRNRPDLTAERFVADRFSKVSGARLYRTGDLVRWLPDGTIECLGRLDHQVKIRGFRIELGEIEAALERHPGVRQAVVVARAYGPGDTRLVGYVVGEAECRGEALQAHLRGMLPEYMVPLHYVVLDRVPLTPNGKVDRNALPAPDGTAVADEYVAPRNPLEQSVAGVWAEVLKVERVGVHDNFFALGGHSLLAVRLFARLEKEIGRTLPLSVLFEAPTVEGLAHLLGATNKDADPWRSLVAIRRAGRNVPIFGVHAGAGQVLFYHGLARALGEDQPFYGLQAPVGLDGADAPYGTYRTIEDLAALYVSEVRRVRPRGPYVLAGSCAGGPIALEMAQRLHAAGESVGPLLIFDSRLVNAGGWVVGRTQRHWDALKKLRGGQRILYVGGRAIGKVTWWLSQLGKHIRPHVIRAWCHARGKRVPQEVIDKLFLEASIRLVVKYQPRPFAGRVLLFRSTETDQQLGNLYEHARTLGWGGLPGCAVEVVDMPGNHLDALAEPTVVEVARIIRDQLDNVLTGGASQVAHRSR